MSGLAKLRRNFIFHGFLGAANLSNCNEKKLIHNFSEPLDSVDSHRQAGNMMNMNSEEPPLQPDPSSSVARQVVPRAAMTSPEHPWPVTMASWTFSQAISTWPSFWLEGQIQEINARRAGSTYITLADSQVSNTTLEVVAFGATSAQAAQFHQGDRVLIHGKPNLYQRFTKLSFLAQEIRRIGQGDLKQQIEELRKKLKGEGLFDADRKLALPEFPHHIGLICAPQARAEGDVKRNAMLRWPTIQITSEYVHVQGESCPPDVIAAVKKLDADPDIDVIIIARGGGAFADLVGFSDEGVVRAVSECSTPVVSAIGHEDDWTLLDLVADLRASTPTDAAKRVVPDVHEQLELIDQLRFTLQSDLQSLVTSQLQLMHGYLTNPHLTHPMSMLEPYSQQLERLSERLNVSLHQYVDSETNAITRSQATLTALSPQKTLDRGYSIIRDEDGHVLSDASQLSSGQLLALLLRHGSATARVENVHD